MLRRLILLVGGILFLATVPVAVGSELVDHLYGRGAHAYYSSDFVQAHELLTAAIEGQSNDPRVYYFRGLVYLELGRPEQAGIDFQKGSRIEMDDVNAFYDVSKALERIQGPDRLEIEQYRSQARVAAMKRAQAVRRTRYEAIRSQEDRVLRKNVELTPQPITKKVSAGEQEETPDSSSEAGDDDFEDTSSKKKTPAKSDDVDPFSGGSDPFSSSTQPEKKAPAEEAPKKKTPEADPFAGGDDDPFGPATPPEKTVPAEKELEEKAPEKKTPEKKTPEADPFAGGDDPFGPATPPEKEAPAEESPKKKAPEKKTPADDPFGGDDPFGDTGRPATGTPKKVAGQSPVTKPASAPSGKVTRPAVSPQPLPRTAKATPEVPSASDPIADKPDKDNPFVEEPITAGNK